MEPWLSGKGSLEHKEVARHIALLLGLEGASSKPGCIQQIARVSIPVIILSCMAATKPMNTTAVFQEDIAVFEEHTYRVYCHHKDKIDWSSAIYTPVAIVAIQHHNFLALGKRQVTDVADIGVQCHEHLTNDIVSTLARAVSIGAVRTPHAHGWRHWYF